MDRGDQREGDFLSPISLQCAPAHGSADIASGMLFGLNPNAEGEGPKGKVEGEFQSAIAQPNAPAHRSGDGG